MGLNLRFCINKTGKTCNVVDRDTWKAVGALNNREAFIYYGAEGEIACICFLDPNGNFKTVNVSSNAAYITNNKSCCDYPYGTATINGTKYYTFKMRSQKTIYYSDGVSKWGSVAAGMLVATRNTKVNPDSPHLKEISYVQWEIHFSLVSSQKYHFTKSDLKIFLNSLMQCLDCIELL